MTPAWLQRLLTRQGVRPWRGDGRGEAALPLTRDVRVPSEWKNPHPKVEEAWRPARGSPASLALVCRSSCCFSENVPFIYLKKKHTANFLCFSYSLLPTKLLTVTFDCLRFNVDCEERL